MDIKLSDKYQRFVDEYLITLNASKAYRNAGFAEKNSGQGGYQLLRTPKIQKAIQKAMEERSRRTHVDQDRVIKELARIGFANIKSIVKSWDGATLNIRDSEEIPDDDIAAIKEITYKIDNNGIQVKVEMYDKLSALKTLWEHVKPIGTDKTDPIEEARKIVEAVAEMGKSIGVRD